MRVLFITGEYPPMKGGIADQTAALGKALEKFDVEWSVLTSFRAAKKNGNETGNGCIFPLVVRWNWRFWGVVKRILEVQDIDTIHIQYQTAAFGMHPAINFLPAWLKRKGIKCPVVTTFHDLREPFLFPKAGRVRGMVNRALFAASDATIVTNEDDFSKLASLKTGLVDKLVGKNHRSGINGVHFVPLGNNLAVHSPAGIRPQVVKPNLSSDEKEIILSYFGFLNDSKGIEFLLHALHSLNSSGRKAKLLMIGADTGDVDPTNKAYKEKILELITAQGIAGSVIWTGYLKPEEVSAYLKSSDICILPFRDGASFRRTTLITALAHGLPVVTTSPGKQNNGLQPGMVAPHLVDGENVMLVPVDDQESIVRAVARITDSPELRQRLSANAVQVANFFSWDTVSERTLEVYRGLL